MVAAPRKLLVIAGKVEVLRSVEEFCRQVYLRAFPAEEAERRLAALTLVDAVALWRSGLPASLRPLESAHHRRCRLDTFGGVQ